MNDRQLIATGNIPVDIRHDQIVTRICLNGIKCGHIVRQILSFTGSAKDIVAQQGNDRGQVRGRRLAKTGLMRDHDLAAAMNVRIRSASL